VDDVASDMAIQKSDMDGAKSAAAQ